MPKKYKLIIGGKRVGSSSHKYFPTINPATGKIIAYFPQGTESDVKKAVAAAEKALPKWKKLPAPKRGQILLKAAQILKQRKTELGKLVTREMGKVLSEGKGDVQEAIDMAEYMAGEGRRFYGFTTPSELPNKFAMTTRNPIGVCGLIAPWNFPIAIPSWKIFPALICGNTMVFKPSSDTPLCAYEFVKVLEEAGVPPGVVNFVTGSGSTVGQEIVTNEKIRAISFTGSVETGKFITSNAGLKKVGLELGGKNGIIVMDDADIDLAVEGVLWGAFGTTGQRCTATSRVLVHKKIKTKFEKKLLSKVRKLKLGDGLKSTTKVGPLINKAAMEKSQEYVEIGKNEGAKMLCGGKMGKGKGFFYQPTIFTNVKKNMRIAKEEIFGPVLSLITFDTIDEAIKTMNAVDYGLSASIYTNDIQNSFKAIENIETGIVYVNSSTIGSEVHLPFGGVKDTGNGTREAGIEGIHEFSESKTIYIDYSGKLQKAQIDEYEKAAK